MLTLRLSNFEAINLKEITALSAAAVKGATTLAVQSNVGYAIGDPLMVGNNNSENTEIVYVSALTGTSAVTVSALKFDHNLNEPVTGMVGDQLKLYRAPKTATDTMAPADTAFAVVGVPIAINVDQEGTDFTDPTGSSSWWYKYTYYNSGSGYETDIAAAIASSVGSTSGYCSLADIREIAGFTNNKYISDAKVDNKRSIAQAEIDSQLGGLYAVPFVAPINPLIADIAARLAAGFLLDDAYGSNTTGTSQDSAQQVTDARAMLARIKSKELILTNMLGGETDNNNSNTVQSWPNDQTVYADESESGGGPAFRISHRY